MKTVKRIRKRTLIKLLKLFRGKEITKYVNTVPVQLWNKTF
jgi:hypothetical protein